MCDLLSRTENSELAHQSPSAVPATNVQLGKLNALASFSLCYPEALLQSCEKYVQINYEH